MNFNCVLVHMLHVFVHLANRITMGKIFSYSNLNQQEGCLVAGVEMQHKGFHPGAWLTSAWQPNQKKHAQNLLFIHGTFYILQTVWWREGRRAHYCQCRSDGVIGIVSSWMKLQSVGKISRKFLEKLKNLRLRSFLCSRGKVQSSNTERVGWEETFMMKVCRETWTETYRVDFGPAESWTDTFKIPQSRVKMFTFTAEISTSWSKNTARLCDVSSFVTTARLWSFL